LRAEVVDYGPIYENLPDDPEEAFLVLEAAFNEELQLSISRLSSNESESLVFIQYISKVLAAIQELSLNSKFSGDSIPDIQDVNYGTYADFSKDVEHYKTLLKIRMARRLKQFSISFDTHTKSKLRHLLAQMRATVDKLDLSESKKEALFARISALEVEIDRNRTRMDVVGALWLETCAKVGEGVDKLEPLRKWVGSIGGLIGFAKTQEGPQAPRLPSSPKPKQIEPPKSGESAIDDDIPF
jgi:hypothetical protein